MCISLSTQGTLQFHIWGDEMDQLSLDRIIQRSKDVATFKTRTYAEIARDPKALAEAAIIVAAVAVAAGIGQVNYGAGGLVAGIILSLLGWVISAAIIYFVGTRVTGTPTTSGSVESLLRTLGYASAPNIFSFLGLIWIVGGLVLFVLSIWTLITTVLAIRAALGMSLQRAIITGFVAWIVAIIVRVLLGLLFGIDIYFTF
jgi:hypothetical protein